MHSERLVLAGNSLPSLALPEAGGGLVRTWDFYDRQNLVVVFVSDPDSNAGRDFLHQLSLSFDGFREQEAELLIVVSASLPQADMMKHSLEWRGRVLADETGELFRRCGLEQESGRLAVAVADRYGSIYYSAGFQGEAIPSVEEILSWLKFIQSQCPE